MFMQRTLQNLHEKIALQIALDRCEELCRVWDARIKAFRVRQGKDLKLETNVRTAQKQKWP